MAQHKMSFVLFRLLIAAMAVILALAYGSYTLGLWRVHYPALNEFPVHGLDVSHHQGEIRWDEIPKDRFGFVFIKATEGGDFKDTKFLQNWRDARRAGFKVGAYHFFTLCKPGFEQAKNFMQTVPREPKALPPVIDLEYVGNCSKRPTREEFIKELDTYNRLVYAHYRQKPIIYTTYEFYRDYLDGTPYQDYAIWIRDIWTKPKPEAFSNLRFWQYADNARIAGIDVPVDLNVSFHPLP